MLAFMQALDACPLVELGSHARLHTAGLVRSAAPRTIEPIALCPRKRRIFLAASNIRIRASELLLYRQGGNELLDVEQSRRLEPA